MGFDLDISYCFFHKLFSVFYYGFHFSAVTCSKKKNKTNKKPTKQTTTLSVCKGRDILWMFFANIFQDILYRVHKFNVCCLIEIQDLSNPSVFLSLKSWQWHLACGALQCSKQSPLLSFQNSAELSQCFTHSHWHSFPFA